MSCEGGGGKGWSTTGENRGGAHGVYLQRKAACHREFSSNERGRGSSTETRKKRRSKRGTQIFLGESPGREGSPKTLAGQKKEGGSSRGSSFWHHLAQKERGTIVPRGGKKGNSHAFSARKSGGKRNGKKQLYRGKERATERRTHYYFEQ